MNRSIIFKSVRAMTVAAMLVTMSVVIGIFCKTFFSFAGGLVRITFEILPIIISGIIFGPIVGSVVGVATDLISYLLSPQTYPPNLVVTLGAALVGAVSGVMSRYVVKKRGSWQIAVSGAAAHIVGSMIVKTVGLYQFFGILVLWRIPLYVVIASIEIAVICALFKRESFRRLLQRI